jgi:hypothetical protein
MAYTNLQSDLGKEVRDSVWAEVTAELTMKVPTLKMI